MDSLTRALLCALVLLGVTPVGAQERSQEQVYRDWAWGIAQKHGLPPALFEAQVNAESQFKPWAYNPVSGACGLLQIVPAYHPGVRCWDPLESLEYGAALMRSYVDRFGSYRLALVAFNAGPSRVTSSRGLPRETQRYLEIVLGDEE